jgi:hypothetical protein
VGASISCGDAAIVKIRRLLLQTLRDHASGKPLPGMHAASYRVRSMRCEAPKDSDSPRRFWTASAPTPSKQ